MLNLRAIQTLVAVVETGSITKAAQRLGTTQPAVSMALRELEDELSAVLIDRSARPLRPTHAGFALYHRAAQLVSDVASLRSLVASATIDKVPLLRVGFVTPFGSTLIKRLQRMATEIVIRSGLTPELLGALHARDLDIVVTSNPALDPPGLDRVRIVSEPYVAVLPRTASATASWENVHRATRDLPFVRYTARSAIGGAVERILRQRGIEPPDRFEFDTSQSVLTTVEAGIGWAITTPICIAQSHLASDAVRVVPLTGISARRQLVVVHRRDEFEPSVERLRALVAEHLREIVQAAFGVKLPWIVAAMEFENEEITI